MILSNFLKIFAILSLLLMGSVAQSKVYSYEIDYSYGDLQKELSRGAGSSASKFYIDFTKKYREGCLKRKKENYNFLGLEFNCSFNLLSYMKGSKQNILDVNLDSLPPMDYNGAKITLVKPVNVQASVKSKRSPYKVNLLDYKKQAHVVEETMAHENITVKHQPYNNSLITSSCANLPGSEIETQLSPVEIFIKKRLFWFISIKAKGLIKIDLGSYNYEDAQLCMANKFDFQGAENLKDVVKNQLVLVEPHFSKISVSGLYVKEFKIKGANFFTKILLSLFKLFKFSVSDVAKRYLAGMLEKNVSGYIKITNENISNGRIWDVINSELVNKSQVKLVSDINSEVSKRFMSGSSSKLMLNKSQINELCEESIVKLEKEEGVLLTNFSCSQIISSAEVKPFYNRADMHKKGCYSHSYILNPSYKLDSQNQNAWWKNSCSIGFQLSVDVEDAFTEAYECYEGYVNKVITDPGICTEKLIGAALQVPLEDIPAIIESNDLNDLSNRLPEGTFNKIRNKVGYL